jgi:DNA invertase Pin-like site-specific DNA recombinase
MARNQAASYLRVSGKGQVEGDGFTRQQAAIAKYATSAGLELVAEFRDEGVSGTTEFADREGLAELLDRIDRNGVRVVIVERADRLARDLIVSELILSEFRRRGVQVIAAEGGVDLTAQTDPTSTLIRQVLGAVSEFEKSCIVAKLKAARDRGSKAAGRRVEGRKPYGFHPAELAAIERIRQLHRKPRGGERLSFASIAATLNSEGIATRTGKPWHGEVVRRIVQRRS